MVQLIALRRCAALLAVLLVIALLTSGVRADQPALQADSGPNAAPVKMLDRIAEFFRLPIVNVALVAVGLIGIFFEFKLPGTTFPGSVAAICFVLFFWAYSFVGQFTLLAILLFLLGLVLVSIEIFVVPGICFAGVAGAGLMFVALLLGTLVHWPQNQNDWTDVGATFGTIAIGLALAAVGAFTLTWSLPNVPILNRMVLQPPPEPVSGTPAFSLSHSGPVELLGAMGVAVTPLRPSGKAQFGDKFIDVIAEGDYVAPGGRVQVIEIEGSRIVVKEIGAPLAV
ncbi:MAG TPA: NfeD family protein [Gemmataceae bacterium]|nr:NfeD family protein [Gemmataceae bacterium]